MLISILTNRINQSLSYAESLNLTNTEEQKLTIQLVKDLIKLLNLILTKEEKKLYKKKVSLVKSSHRLKKLKQHVFESKKSNYYSFLSLTTNFRLFFWPSSEKTKKQIINDLSQTIGNNQPDKMRKEDYLIFEDDFNEVPNREQYRLIKSELNDHNCKNIIIPSTLIKQMTPETQLNFIQLQGDIIISLNKTVDFNACLHFLKERFKASREFKTGISFNVLQRESIKLIDTLCEKLSLNEKEQTIIRIKKGQTIYTEDQALKPNQLIKVNTFYKWGLFTILNLIRRHKIKLIINCNNLYDISWLYIQRAQMNIEAQTFFEVNILKFPNISKISFLFCEQNIQSKSTLASSNYDHNLKIIIKKLISQANLFEGYHSSPLNTKSIFFKSHHRFFIYLKHNFLKTYLKKISIDE